MLAGLVSDVTLARIAGAEANVAAQVGLSIALGAHLVGGPDRIRARLAEVDAMTRIGVADVAGTHR